EIAMHANARVFVIVEPRAAELAIVHPKAERLDEMQFGAGVRREANHVAGIRRDFGVDEDHGEHHDPLTVRATTHASTRTAPALRSARAAAPIVAPVVITSSTIAMLHPAIASLAANASRTLRTRWRSVSPACGGASRIRVSPRASGTSTHADSRRAISCA